MSAISPSSRVLSHTAQGRRAPVSQELVARLPSNFLSKLESLYGGSQAPAKDLVNKQSRADLDALRRSRAVSGINADFRQSVESILRKTISVAPSPTRTPSPSTVRPAQERTEKARRQPSAASSSPPPSSQGWDEERQRLQRSKVVRQTLNNADFRQSMNGILQRIVNSPGFKPESALMDDHHREMQWIESILQSENEMLREEIRELNRDAKVRETLHSSFRHDLEELLAVHDHLRRNGYQPDAAAPSPPAPPAVPHHVAPAPEPPVAAFSTEPLQHSPLQQQVDAISAAAQAQANATVTAQSAEIARLTQQVAELTQLMHANFSLNLNIQQMVQQEVSAALHHMKQSPSTQPLPAPLAPHSAAVRTLTAQAASPPMRPEGTCVVCCDQAADCVLYRCGHLCVCMDCGHSLHAQEKPCPICRAPIQDIIRTFKA